MSHYERTCNVIAISQIEVKYSAKKMKHCWLGSQEKKKNKEKTQRNPVWSVKYCIF